MYQINHAIYNGEISNAISTPFFEYRIGKIVNNREVKAISVKHGHITQFYVYWKPVVVVMTDHKSYF